MHIRGNKCYQNNYLLPGRIHFIDNVLGIVVAAKEGRQDGAVVRCIATSDASRFSLAWFDGVGDLNCSALVGPVQCNDDDDGQTCNARGVSCSERGMTKMTPARYQCIPAKVDARFVRCSGRPGNRIRHEAYV